MYQWKVPVFGSLAAVATSLSEEKNEVTGKKKKTFEDQVYILEIMIKIILSYCGIIKFKVFF